mmetsp:Transcript_30148/g.69898  ORF Transcript_30148/g.69898 Transcript_30148/m.69898 type:complete len:95 (+) Transcript_30148:1-285(+)
MSWGAENGWAVYFTLNERANLPLYELFGRFGGVHEMLNGLMNLRLALTCRAWVCTLGSNWCSLIDELRATVMRQANAPYVNIGFGAPGTDHYYP